MPDNDDLTKDDIVNNDNVIEGDVVETTHDLSVDDIEHKNTDLDSALNRLAGIADDPTKKVDPTKATPLQQGTKPPVDPKQTKDPNAVQQTQQPQRAPAGGWTGKAPRAYGQRFNWDAQGNVVDLVSKTIVATAGAERKSFERMLPLINSATAEADKYKGMYESAEKANVTAASLGLNPEEYAIGARIMAAWKKDPKNALAFLIKEAQNNGIDTSDIGVSGGGVTRKDIEDAVKNLLGETIKPFNFLVEERQTRLQQEQEYNEAVNFVEEFMASHEDARIHEQSLNLLMQRGLQDGNPISLETAYLILQNHALKNGLDWNKDLIAQVKEKMGQGGTPPNRQPASRQLPNVNGRVPNTDVVTRQTPSSLSGNASTGDIVKDAMREAGMDVSRI